MCAIECCRMGIIFAIVHIVVHAHNARDLMNRKRCVVESNIAPVCTLIVWYSSFLLLLNQKPVQISRYRKMVFPSLSPTSYSKGARSQRFDFRNKRAYVARNSSCALFFFFVSFFGRRKRLFFLYFRYTRSVKGTFMTLLLFLNLFSFVLLSSVFHHRSNIIGTIPIERSSVSVYHPHFLMICFLFSLIIAFLSFFRWIIWTDRWYDHQTEGNEWMGEK